MATVFDPTAFPGQFSWRQAYWTAALSAMAYDSSIIPASSLSDYYGVQSWDVVEINAPLDNRITIAHFPGLAYCAIEGTARWAQWQNYVADFGDDIFLEPSWYAGKYFSSLAQQAATRIQSAQTQGKNLVLCGHSLGGAVASLTAEILRRAGRSVLAVWTIGSPKPGNYQLFLGYTVPNFRLYGTNDPVPSLPPEIQAAIMAPNISEIRTRLPYHVGEPVELGSLDVVEVIGDFVGEFRNFDVIRPAGLLAAHCCGSYTEAIWSRLSPSERGGYQRLFNYLVSRGAQGLPNWPMPVEPIYPPDQAEELTEADERAAFTAISNNPSGVTVRLYVNDVPSDKGTQPSDFTEPTFPGYAHQSPAIPFTIGQGVNGYPVTNEQYVVFRLTADLPAPVSIRGGWCMVGGPGSPPVVAKCQPFTTPASLQHKDDFVQVVVSLALARVT